MKILLKAWMTGFGRRMLFVAVASTFLSGCSNHTKTFPVDGRVVYEDGTALTDGRIEFLTVGPDGKSTNARATITKNGTFVLSTFKEGDGAVPGEYQAIIMGSSVLPTGDLRKVVRPKGPNLQYKSYATSGLKFHVKPEDNHFVITITREK